MGDSEEPCIIGYESIDQLNQPVKPSSKKREMNESSNPATAPPAYTVIEDKDGKMTHQRLSSSYLPIQKRKNRRRHKFEIGEKWEEYFSSDDEHRTSETESTRPAQSFDSHSSNSSAVTSPLGENEKRRDPNDPFSFFVGACTTEEVVKQLNHSMDFVLYYQVPMPGKKIPLIVPLTLAYRSSSDKIFHFPIGTSTIAGATKWWYVKYGDPTAQKFESLESLINYYTIFSFVEPSSGNIDTFPVWKGVVLDLF